jgi:uncharacterized protein
MAVSWVEIPVVDIERAAVFYSKMFDTELSILDQGVRKLVILPNSNNGIGASLNQSNNFLPGDQGPLVYLNGGQDLNPMLQRAEAAGGAKITSKTDLGGNGFYAIIRDTEGNHIALMSAS